MNRYLLTVMEQDAERKRFNRLYKQTKKALDLQIQEENLIKCGGKLYREEDIGRVKRRMDVIITIIAAIAFVGAAGMIYANAFMFFLPNVFHQYAVFGALAGNIVMGVFGLFALMVYSVQDVIVTYRKKPVMTVGTALRAIIDDAEGIDGKADDGLLI